MPSKVFSKKESSGIGINQQMVTAFFGKEYADI